MNKRGVVFGMYIVILTLAMVSMVLVSYVVIDGNQKTAIVSPRAVLAVEEDLKVYEIREKELIMEALREIEEDLEFGGTEFREALRENFLEKAILDGPMGEFIFKELYYGGEKKLEWTQFTHQKSFFSEILYPGGSITKENGLIVFRRAEVGKRFILIPKKSKISFPVDFEYNFDRTYYIEKSGEEFKFVEVEDI